MNVCPYNVIVILLRKSCSTIVILVKEQMNYTLMPSLEHFALIKTAITLWNPDDIPCHLTAKYYFTEEKWKVQENCMIEKVKELPLPELLKRKVLCFIRPISNEIHKCICDNRLLYCENTIGLRSLARKIFRKVCWSPHGTIDEKKTAERLIRDEDLDITERYKLACHNCLENDILMLWNRMPQDSKKSFYDEKDIRLVKQHTFVVFWTYVIKGEVTRTHRIHIFNYIRRKYRSTPYQYVFHCAVSSGNKAATEHFLQKQTSEEREESLERAKDIVTRFPNYETLCYLLSQMNEVQQVGMFRKHPYKVLRCLLKWPFQGLFMKIAKHVCTFLPPIHYFSLLKEIFERVDNGFKDYDYQKLIAELWQLIPITQKERLISDGNIEFFLRRLLKIKDIENFKLILKDVAITDRKKIIFSKDGTHICKKLIYADEMDLLEFFVQECISSKDLMIKFREKLERYIKYYHTKKALEMKKDLLNKAFQLLNDLTQKFDKRRCVEEGYNGPVKRLCSLTRE